MGTSQVDPQQALPERPAVRAAGADSVPVDLSGADEPTLIALFQAGSPDQQRAVWAELYGRFAPAVLTHAKCQGLPLEEAENVAGQTWVVATRRLPTFVWQGQPLVAWLKAIVNTLCLKVWADLGRTEVFSDGDTEAAVERLADPHPHAARDLAAGAPSSEPDSADLERFLVTIRGCLRPADRQLLDLLYFKQLDATQAALVLGKSPAAVRKAHERLRQRLVNCAGRHGLRLPPTWRLLRKSS